jgi:hypothetical protein
VAVCGVVAVRSVVARARTKRAHVSSVGLNLSSQSNAFDSLCREFRRLPYHEVRRAAQSAGEARGCGEGAVSSWLARASHPVDRLRSIPPPRPWVCGGGAVRSWLVGAGRTVQHVQRATPFRPNSCGAVDRCRRRIVPCHTRLRHCSDTPIWAAIRLANRPHPGISEGLRLARPSTLANVVSQSTEERSSSGITFAWLT